MVARSLFYTRAPTNGAATVQNNHLEEAKGNTAQRHSRFLQEETRSRAVKRGGSQSYLSWKGLCVLQPASSYGTAAAILLKMPEPMLPSRLSVPMQSALV
ncbi:hypothetical protein KIL84_020925 [Mauremys mutica]|uniref:Uncharacterized protein n=1 Tax=Mauremys mutica TaxID=74926 RepID=A0A9D4B0W8_9SAUR|nr:hypothetical protein KIL84_020925 [Mauremys mutica]